MRYAPPYSADRLPADLIVSVLTGLAGAAVVGPATWWFALRYLLRTYPGHPEMRSAAMVVGVLDGLLHLWWCKEVQVGADFAEEVAEPGVVFVLAMLGAGKWEVRAHKQHALWPRVRWPAVSYRVLQR